MDNHPLQHHHCKTTNVGHKLKEFNGSSEQENNFLLLVILVLWLCAMLQEIKLDWCYSDFSCYLYQCLCH